MIVRINPSFFCGTIDRFAQAEVALQKWQTNTVRQKDALSDHNSRSYENIIFKEAILKRTTIRYDSSMCGVAAERLMQLTYEQLIIIWSEQRIDEEEPVFVGEPRMLTEIFRRTPIFTNHCTATTIWLFSLLAIWP